MTNLNCKNYILEISLFKTKLIYIWEVYSLISTLVYHAS